jgi:hypothetical protein
VGGMGAGFGPRIDSYRTARAGEWWAHSLRLLPREGFAEWVGYKVVDTFRAQDFTDSRKRTLDSIGTATSYQTFPSLLQLARNPDWITCHGLGGVHLLMAKPSLL